MTKISNQYSLTNILTADLANSRLGINNVSPAYSLDVTGTARVSGQVNIATSSSGYTTPSLLVNAGASTAIPLQAVADSTGGRLFRFYTSDFNNSTTGTSIRLNFGAATGNTSANLQVYTGGEQVVAGSILALQPSGGNVGIGTTSPGARLEVAGADTTIRLRDSNGGVTDFGNDSVGTYWRDFSNNTFRWLSSAGTERMRITSGGNVGIGTTTPGVKLEVNGGGSAVSMTIATNGATTAGTLWDGGGAPSFHAWSRPQDCGIGSNNFAGGSILIKTGMTYGSFTTGTTRIEIQSSGAVVIPGSLSKGSGSFRIDHPLKPDTHQLVHSFIEGPQADLIYRGKLTLVNGKAQANIDEVSTMTEGTFEALCREVQCFTTNENGWDLVKGKVIGNIIYIESQNQNSTDEISWMVIGERKDKHMMDTEWTDEQGKVIVEPLKA